MSNERPARILIADDNPQAAELLGEFLDGLGYELAVAEDGEKTLQAVASWKPDAILLDVMMPRVSGFEVCKRLRADPATRDIAILMVTALDQHSDIERAVEAGTDDFLSKPLSKAELLRRIPALLAARKQRSDLDRTLEYIEGVEGGSVTPTMSARVVLQPRRARPFYGRHPWVFAGAVAAVEGDAPDGGEVDLVSSTGQFVARGIYNSQSKIRVRLYSWQPEQVLDGAFFRERLASAVRLRETLGLMKADGACRLVFSEGDGLSGLVVDRYADRLAVQFTALGMAQRREQLADLLTEICQPAGIYLRTEKGIGQLEGLELQDGPMRGTPPGALVIDEDGLRFRVNLAEGQKTGFYLDQRDNRRVVAALARDRRVLDAFCYSGGFALHAARAGAAEVIGVDASEAALTLARENAAENGLGVTFHKSDVFDDLDDRVRRGERFGMVVLDPPKFARRKNAVDEALRGYRRLQTMALRLLEPEGILVTCCCSGLIDLTMLEDLLAQVSADEKRLVQLLMRRGPSADHPVAVSCPESHYLKCLIARAV